MVKQLRECCCFSLKTGTIIIGALGIFTGLSMMASPFVKEEPKENEPTGLELMNKLDFTSRHDTEHEQTFSVVLKVVMALVELVMSIVLIVGAVQGRPKLVYSWIVLNVVQNGLAVIVLLTLGVYLMVTGMFLVGVTLLVVLTIMSLIQGYFILIVNSYHTTILSPPTYEYTMTKEPIMSA